MDHGKNYDVIKAYANKNFELALVETKSGQYYIVYEMNDSVVQSEPINDYKTAAFLFDSKLSELQGH